MLNANTGVMDSGLARRARPGMTNWYPPFINIKFSGKGGDTYPRFQNLHYPAPVLSNEGALLEAILKWDRARAGRKG